MKSFEILKIVKWIKTEIAKIQKMKTNVEIHEFKQKTIQKRVPCNGFFADCVNTVL